MDVEQAGEFAGRVLGAFLALVALAAIVLAFVVIAWLSAPSQKRHIPVGTPTPAASMR